MLISYHDSKCAFWVGGGRLKQGQDLPSESGWKMEKWGREGGSLSQFSVCDKLNQKNTTCEKSEGEQSPVPPPPHFALNLLLYKSHVCIHLLYLQYTS